MWTFFKKSRHFWEFGDTVLNRPYLDAQTTRIDRNQLETNVLKGKIMSFPDILRNFDIIILKATFMSNLPPDFDTNQ